ncbi:putative pfs domain-containing protein [Rosellinia necatrix]|uniref:Putative pfs domain-containing protein n=1 Tax=Rosellinia necatrix TaxID=77044 RepID=A0A1S8A9W7_ROSNE|nr:putative pfs domain-containing protein [Rosellinia necatrix]
MRVYYPFPGTSNEIATYDEIYVESWEQALKECQMRSEEGGHERALQVKTLQNFRSELGVLMKQYPNEHTAKAISLIHPTLDHYETFAQNFVAMMESPVDTSMMWGSEYKERASALSRITKWLETIGHKLRASNDYYGNITDLEKVKGDTVEVNKEIVILWLNIIMTFRSQEPGTADNVDNDESAWEALSKIYNEAYQTIDEAVGRIEKVAEMAKRQARAMKEITMLQRYVSLGSSQGQATLPCNTLPVAENHRFFGRQNILREIEAHLTPADTNSRLSSIALYGLGGIGKTQIALAYAYQKLEHLDAVFWISAEDAYSVQLSFSRVAVDALKLPNAHAQAYQENMLLVRQWLQNTPAKWLLVFDNVDSHDVLDNCWPVSKHGAVLVTTRDEVIATLPIDTGLEVSEFDVEDGADFLLHMAPKRRRTAGEREAALGVAGELGGLPLALNQMAALINARNCTIADFGAMYAKHEHRLHKQRKSGWKYLGYEHGLDTVWELSFENLGEEARSCLGVLSFFAADLIPSDVFRTTTSAELPERLRFCEDELRHVSHFFKFLR